MQLYVLVVISPRVFADEILTPSASIRRNTISNLKNYRISYFVYLPAHESSRICYLVSSNHHTKWYPSSAWLSRRLTAHCGSEYLENKELSIKLPRSHPLSSQVQGCEENVHLVRNKETTHVLWIT